MAGEAIKVYATTINHIVDGPSLAATVFSAASDVDTALSSTNTLDYPVADIVLTVTFASAPTVLGQINLYRQSLNIVSTNDEPEPDTTYTHKFVGSFTVDAVTSAQYLEIAGVPLSKECNFIIENDTDQTSSANFDLDVKPWTFNAAA